MDVPKEAIQPSLFGYDEETAHVSFLGGPEVTTRTSCLKWVFDTLFILSRFTYGAQIAEALEIFQLYLIHMFTAQWCSSLPDLAPSIVQYKSDCKSGGGDLNAVMITVALMLAIYSTAFTFPVYLKEKQGDSCSSSLLLHPLSGYFIQAIRISIALSATSPKNPWSFLVFFLLLVVSIPGVTVTVSYERLKSVLENEFEKSAPTRDRVNGCYAQSSLSSVFFKASVVFFIIINSISSAFSLNHQLNQSLPKLPSWLAMIASGLCAFGNIIYLIKLNHYVLKDYHKEFLEKLNSNHEEDVSFKQDIFKCFGTLPLSQYKNDKVKGPAVFVYILSALMYRFFLFTIQATDILNEFNVQQNTMSWYLIISINGLSSIVSTYAGPGRFFDSIISHAPKPVSQNAGINYSLLFDEDSHTPPLGKGDQGGGHTDIISSENKPPLPLVNDGQIDSEDPYSIKNI